MVRTFASASLFVVATSVVAAMAAPTSSAAAANRMARGQMLCQHEYCDDWSGHDGCEHHDCCCHHKAPEITVHVIQPPPTFIYDVTHTACYTEHHDCCGCPYVCGPTCIPQGEVLAPANVGRRVAIADGCCKGKHHHHDKQ
ncbi:hypothetical protein IW140_003593 [Coemansia sp. RSA 1813]|nr:hypothetical protein EV178_003438 [Coemansia sp. RSA 1646]KAJ1769330.1 hypothetical protein LPJ74_004157 [Coemansia sp. RSA 1843]KAJ2089098.1 hypothetical protein IW138_003678 [Coemansia sp. RSA 986]KAJ2215644.1 hypothetical protein EV179_002055 [Coemansia sp. RSA 487]KAJ2568836.1 hypothetical protein IW140_003593 [Coemansia sp. RSA 1813]